MFDVVIVGAGVVGGMIARRLSQYNLGICIVDKENDVAMGSTKANSAIVHAGFDAAEGSLKAKLNVRGSQMMEQIASELGVKYKRNGSLVIGFTDEDRQGINELYSRGIKNGVSGLKILNKEELKELEPNISENVNVALLAETGAIVCPYELTIAAIGNAMDNGTNLKLEFKVTSIEETGDTYKVYSEEECIEAKYVINAAGLYSDEIAGMVGDKSFKITPRKGEYILLDKDCGDIVKRTIFRTPTKAGKGILITPTVDGNLLTGPTSVNIENKDDTSTTQEGFGLIIKETLENVTSVSYSKSITSFCGLRAAGNTGDFIINSPRERFINVAGIESPGLSASPAIAEYVEEMLISCGLVLKKKEDYNPYRKSMHSFRDATIEEKNKIIEKDKSYGKIVCRCEQVTEGEILEAIRTNPKPKDMDGVKRRTRAQMGRCQGGFCSPYIIELLAKEQGISCCEVTKNGGNSRVITGVTKEAKK